MKEEQTLDIPAIGTPVHPIELLKAYRSATV